MTLRALLPLACLLLAGCHRVLPFSSGATTDADLSARDLDSRTDRGDRGAGDSQPADAGWEVSAPGCKATCADADLNSDGSVDASDLGAFAQCKSKPPVGACHQSDLTGDGAIDEADESCLAALLPACP